MNRHRFHDAGLAEMARIAKRYSIRMAGQNFHMTTLDPPIANLAAIVATTETALWSAAQFSPISPNEAKAQRVFCVEAGGIMSFAATGTLTITPRWGLTTAGITMGASIAKTTPGATTNQSWSLYFKCVVRSVGPSGANSVVTGSGWFATNGLTTAGSEFILTFGGTPATVDVSVATGLTMGWTLSVAGTVTPQWVHMQNMNE